MEINNKFYPVLLMPNWVDKAKQDFTNTIKGKKNNNSDYESNPLLRKIIAKTNKQIDEEFRKSIEERFKLYVPSFSLTKEDELRSLKSEAELYKPKTYTNKEIDEMRTRMEKGPDSFSDRGCLFGLLLFSFFVIWFTICFLKNFKGDSHPNFGWIIVIIIGFAIMIWGWKKYGKSEEEIDKKINEIRSEHTYSGEKYQENYDKWNEIQQKIKKLEQEIENERIAKERSEKNKTAKDNAIFCKCARLFHKPSTPFMEVYDGPQKGYTEDALFSALMKKNAINNWEVKIDTEVGIYYPDIVIVCNDICIDIEIDEPYSYEEGQETHYIGSRDEKRNQFFVDNNWIVIRFSEKQIATDLNKCVMFIESVYTICNSVFNEKTLTENNKNVNMIYEELNNFAESFRDPRWTKEEARMMRINNYRDSY